MDKKDEALFNVMLRTHPSPYRSPSMLQSFIELMEEDYEAALGELLYSVLHVAANNLENSGWGIAADYVENFAEECGNYKNKGSNSYDSLDIMAESMIQMYNEIIRKVSNPELSEELIKLRNEYAYEQLQNKSSLRESRWFVDFSENLHEKRNIKNIDNEGKISLSEADGLKPEPPPSRRLKEGGIKRKKNDG